LSDAQTDLKSFNLLLNERDPLVIRRTLQVARLVHSLPDRIRQRIARARKMMQANRLDEFDAPQAERLGELEQSLDALVDQSDKFARRSQEFTDLVLGQKNSGADGKEAEHIETLQSTLREDARRLGERIATLRSELRRVTDRALDRANDNERSSLYALGGLSALALLLALGVLFAVIRIVRPLSTLTEATKRIGEGDYRPIDELPKTWMGRDEITLLAEEFNSMAGKLAERDAKLREQHEQLLRSERLATVGRMTSAITHELRNPLSSINLNSEMLLESLLDKGVDEDDPDIMPLLETIIDEVDRLRDITEEYLVYARLPSSDLEPDNLVDVVQNLVDFHRSEWAQGGVQVELEVERDEIEVQADANHLRQALLNIIKNGIEASPEGERLEVTVTDEGGSAAVTIRDYGPGLDEEIRSRLFEPFATTKSDGTGLGLAMTQQIIEEHHGDIEVENPDSGGCRFIIRIPKEPPAEHR
jgi:signal transduction histidine kinase